MWYFYVLQSDGAPDYFYKGSTGDLRRRLVQYSRGEVQTTRSCGPFRLVYYEAYRTERTARLRERSVKRSGSVSVPRRSAGRNPGQGRPVSDRPTRNPLRTC